LERFLNENFYAYLSHPNHEHIHWQGETDFLNTASTGKKFLQMDKKDSRKLGSLIAKITAATKNSGEKRGFGNSNLRQVSEQSENVTRNYNENEGGRFFQNLAFD
jgi:hypothetical protein